MNLKDDYYINEILRTAIIVIIVIIVVVLLLIPAQMIFPFPYGLGIIFFIIILGIVGIIVAKRNYKKREKFAEEDLKYQHEQDEPEEHKKDDKSWDGI